MPRVRNRRHRLCAVLRQWLVGGAILLTAACSGGQTESSLEGLTGETILHQYQSVSPDRWDRLDTLSFQFPKLEETITADVDIMLRFTYEAVFEQVQLSAVLRCVDSLKTEDAAPQLLTYTLFDADGRIQGRSFQHPELRQTLKHLRLEASRNYQLLISHRMRVRSLSGITDIGVRLRKQ